MHSVPLVVSFVFEVVHKLTVYGVVLCQWNNNSLSELNDGSGGCCAVQVLIRRCPHSQFSL